MSAKQHLNFHGTVSTFCSSASPVYDWSTCVVSANAFNSSNCAFNNEREGESISMFACVEEDRVSRVQDTRVTRFRVGRSRCSRLWDCVSSRAIVSNSFVAVALETCQCAKHCANDFGDFGVLHGVHQYVLGASRVALRLGRCVLLTEGCDRRGILQHLLRTLLLLLTGVGICSAATMTCANGLKAVVWAGWLVSGSWS